MVVGRGGGGGGEGGGGGGGSGGGGGGGGGGEGGNVGHHVACLVLGGEGVEERDEDVVEDAARAMGTGRACMEGFGSVELCLSVGSEDKGDSGDVNGAEVGSVGGVELAVSGDCEVLGGDGDVESSVVVGVEQRRSSPCWAQA